MRSMIGQTSELPAPPVDPSLASWRAVFRALVIGADTRTPDGRALVNLDNAATTPPLRPVRDTVEDLLPWYGSIHRGAGYKARVCSDAYEGARAEVLRFVGAPDGATCVFVKHATEGLNLLAHRLVGPGDRVLVSAAEHHANLLPWRAAGEVEHLPLDADGAVPPEAVEAALRRAPARVVALSGASNVTGHAPRIDATARVAHEHGALVVLDAAQLVAHRRIGMADGDAAGCPDAVVFSGHKAFAPYGAGAVVVRPELLAGGRPLLYGGGMARDVTLDSLAVSPAPAGDEGGTPNLLGVVALGVALATLDELGMDRLEAAEDELVAIGLAALAQVPGLHLYGATTSEDRIGVFTFALDGWDPSRAAQALDRRAGIAVRAGRFCAHPLVDHLRVAAGLAGSRDAVRASVAAYSTPAELEGLAAALHTMQDLAPDRRAAWASEPTSPSPTFDLRARVRGLAGVRPDAR